MIQFMLRRSLELQAGYPPATACKPGEVWNFKTTIVLPVKHK